LQFQQKNDLKMTLVRVAQSSNELSFRLNVNRTKCVKKILDAFIPSSTKNESALDNEDAITDQDDAVYCLLKKYLKTKYADQFALAAKDLGLPVHKEKMPPARAVAMMQEANFFLEVKQELLLLNTLMLGMDGISYPQGHNLKKSCQLQPSNQQFQL
jgi:hypothetical protein